MGVHESESGESAIDATNNHAKLRDTIKKYSESHSARYIRKDIGDIHAALGGCFKHFGVNGLRVALERGKQC